MPLLIEPIPEGNVNHYFSNIDFGPFVTRLKRVSSTPASRPVSEFSTFTQGNDDVEVLVVEDRTGEVTLEWDITFSEPVTGVSQDDFRIRTSLENIGSLFQIISVQPISGGSEPVYRVTARKPANNQNLRQGYITLGLVNDPTIFETVATIDDSDPNLIISANRRVDATIQTRFKSNHVFFAMVLGKAVRMNRSAGQVRTRILDLDRAPPDDLTISLGFRIPRWIRR